jgi:hypothetical protein
MNDKISVKDAQAEINGLLVAEICRDFGINFRGVYPKHILARGVGPEQAFIGLAIKRGHLALPAVQPKVKPLVWDDADQGICTKWRAAAFQGHYELVTFKNEKGWAVNFSWGRPFSFWFIQGDDDDFGPTGPKMFPDLEAAKAAAQADYEARILSALDNSTGKETK